VSNEHLNLVVDTDRREAAAVSTAPRSLLLGGSGHGRVMLLSEHKMAEFRRRYGPPRGGGGGCRKGCLIIAIPIIAIPIIAIFIIGFVLTLATRLG